ncbi:MAG: SMC-Scp complex subunit ScpB, partial [Verrucomicrobia bacterium]|nr:SMC-Scp complex subunit ScpB [Cytophagales bacterium]
MDFLQNHIEALIFCNAQPIKKEELQACLNEMLATEIPMEDIENTLIVLSDKYKDE